LVSLKRRCRRERVRAKLYFREAEAGGGKKPKFHGEETKHNFFHLGGLVEGLYKRKKMR